METRKKLIYGLVLVVVVLCAWFIYVSLSEKPPVTFIPREVKINGVYLTESKTIQDFKLTDHKGKPFSKDNLMGHWTMMFFGFTNCGYVCPTTMAELNKMYQQLKSELPGDKLPQVVLVTVDPERDSMSKMNDYINAFNADFIGARAELEETEALEKQLHITAIKIASEDNANQYMVNHSSEILIVNPNGQVQAYLSFPPKSDQLVKDYKTILATEIS